jgi:acyl-coenzyme A synthetase/AMP-(fatty) acid ligase
VADMILKEGAVADRATALSIFRLLGERLSSFKRVRRIAFVDALPKTISGKIRRVELRRREHVPPGSEPPVPDGPVFDLAGFTAGELGS